MAEKSKKYCYFWRSGSPFSQWHPSTYKLDGYVYSCAEQGMMHGKALLFEDQATAQLILEAKSPREMKALGRKVGSFSEKIWKKNRWDIVYRNSVAKFAQNPHLYEALMSTAGKQLVEASPSDRVWGIGLHEKNARKIAPNKWPGLNLLGDILTQVRDDFLKASEEDSQKLNTIMYLSIEMIRRRKLNTSSIKGTVRYAASTYTR